MFADLGHFSYMAIQVHYATSTIEELFSHFVHYAISVLYVALHYLMHTTTNGILKG